MVSFTYNDANSIEDGGDWWDRSILGHPDTIIVAADAFIFNDTANLAPNNYVDGLKLLGGSFTVTVNGTVGTSAGVDADGILLLSSSGTSKITVGATGTIFSIWQAIHTEHATNITNAGYIQGQASAIAHFGLGNWSIANTGEIDSADGQAIFIGRGGQHTIVNKGVIFAESGVAIQELSISGVGLEKVANSGFIHGQVYLGDGADTFTNFVKINKIIVNGTVDNLINMGAGDDIFAGGSSAESVVDEGGKDTYKLGGGADTFFAVGSNAADGNVDTVNGGSGIDWYDASNSGDTVLINLDTVTRTDSVNSISAAASTAIGIAIGTDKLTAIENVSGGSGRQHFRFGCGQRAPWQRWR